jgi:hypothetical protein
MEYRRGPEAGCSWYIVRVFCQLRESMQVSPPVTKMTFPERSGILSGLNDTLVGILAVLQDIQ